MADRKQGAGLSSGSRGRNCVERGRHAAAHLHLKAHAQKQPVLDLPEMGIYNMDL